MFNGKLLYMKYFGIPRLQDILFLGIFSAVVLLGPSLLNTDGDLPRHIAMGRYIIQSGQIPITDVFSHTAYGINFAPHEWLSGVIFFLFYTFFGLNGIIILSATILATTFTLIYTKGIKRTGIRFSLFWVTVFGAMISSLHWIARPHLITMLFLAIWLELTERLSKGEKIKLWSFPVLMVLWTNLHGEFVIGLLVLITYLAGWTWDFIFHKTENQHITGFRLGVACGLSAIASLVNPVGVRIWTTVLGYINNNYLTSHTNEYNPPDFLQPKFLVLLAFLALSIFLLATKKDRITTSHAFLLTGFTIMSLVSARNIHLYGVVAPFVLATTLMGSEITYLTQRLELLFTKVEEPLKGKFWPVATILIFSLSLALMALQGQERNRFDPGIFPVKAVEWLKANPQSGNMLNYFTWGGYLILNLWPEKLVFIDGQTDVYGEKITRDYEQIITMAPGWQDVIDKYNVKWALLPAEWRLGDDLVQNGWREVYQDGTAVILIK